MAAHAAIQPAALLALLLLDENHHEVSELSSWKT
jgi:hypothetical protein